MPSIRIYTTPWCAYCFSARRLLQRRGLPYEEINVAHDPQTRAWLVEATGQRTVPQIFIGDTSVGGFVDLAAAERSGELDRLLALP